MKNDREISPFVCISRKHGDHWEKILDGTYDYTYADHGHIIVAIENSKPTNEVVFSDDFGKTWRRYKFSDEQVRVNEFLKYPNNDFKFLIFGSKKDNAEQHIYLFEFKEKPIDHTEPFTASNMCNDKCIAKGTTNLICIDNLKCNGVVECEDDTDEYNCNSDVVPESQTADIDIEENLDTDYKNNYQPKYGFILAIGLPPMSYPIFISIIVLIILIVFIILFVLVKKFCNIKYHLTKFMPTHYSKVGDQATILKGKASIYKPTEFEQIYEPNDYIYNINDDKQMLVIS